MTSDVWTTRWHRDASNPPFELPPNEETGLRWLREPNTRRPILLYPNINVSNDTLATKFMLSLNCTISIIPHYITREHWLAGKSIETLVKLGADDSLRGDDEEPTNVGRVDLEAVKLCGRLVIEWFKTRNQRGQCLHDPLTIYEAVYSSPNTGSDFVARQSCLRYVRGHIVCHSWAGFLTFVPNPFGPHRLAAECINAARWTDTWCGPTLVASVPTSMQVEEFNGFKEALWS